MAFVVLVVAVAATAQTLVGFGFALIAVPLFVAVLDVRNRAGVEQLGMVTRPREPDARPGR